MSRKKENPKISPVKTRKKKKNKSNNHAQKKAKLKNSQIELVSFENHKSFAEIDLRPLPKPNVSIEDGYSEEKKEFITKYSLDKWENVKKALRKHYAQEEINAAPKPKSPHEVVGIIMKRLHESKLKGDNYEVIVEPIQAMPSSNHGTQLISEVMSTKVTCIIDSTTIEQLAGLFNKRKINAVPVVNYKTRHFLGLVNMADILAHTLPKKIFSIVQDGQLIHDDRLDILEEPVRNFMNPNLFSEVPPHCSVQRACEIMINKNLHHLVITHNHRVKGIFSSFDALKILAKNFSKTMSSQQEG